MKKEKNYIENLLGYDIPQELLTLPKETICDENMIEEPLLALLCTKQILKNTLTALIEIEEYDFIEYFNNLLRTCKTYTIHNLLSSHSKLITNPAIQDLPYLTEDQRVSYLKNPALKEIAERTVSFPDYVKAVEQTPAIHKYLLEQEETPDYDFMEKVVESIKMDWFEKVLGYTVDQRILKLSEIRGYPCAIQDLAVLKYRQDQFKEWTEASIKAEQQANTNTIEGMDLGIPREDLEKALEWLRNEPDTGELEEIAPNIYGDNPMLFKAKERGYGIPWIMNDIERHKTQKGSFVFALLPDLAGAEQEDLKELLNTHTVLAVLNAPKLYTNAKKVCYILKTYQPQDTDKILFIDLKDDPTTRRGHSRDLIHTVGKQKQEDIDYYKEIANIMTTSTPEVDKLKNNYFTNKIDKENPNLGFSSNRFHSIIPTFEDMKKGIFDYMYWSYGNETPNDFTKQLLQNLQNCADPKCDIFTAVKIAAGFDD